MTPSRAEKDRAAHHAGILADAYFGRLCNKLGEDYQHALAAPLLTVAAALEKSRREPA